MWDKAIANHRPIRPTGPNRPVYPSRQVEDIIPLFYIFLLKVERYVPQEGTYKEQVASRKQ